MNKKIFVVAPLLLAMFLASCGTKNNGGKKDPEPDTPVEPGGGGDPVPPTPTWNEEQQNVMKTHFYGEVLPYYDFGEMTVAYDDYLEEVNIKGGEVKEGDIAKYAALYEAAGWEGGDVSLYNDLPEGSAYTYEKMVKTAEGDRYVYVEFYAVQYDDEYYYYISDKGNFLLVGYDPYYYEFPTFPATYFAYMSTNAYDEYYEEEEYDKIPLPPAFNAHHYGVNRDARAIYCYAENPSGKTDAGYSETLTAAEWTVLEEKDEDGYYVAISPDENYQIAYFYDEEYGDLDIYFEAHKKPAPIYDSWQASVIEDLFTKYDATPIEIPSYNAVRDGLGYQFFEDEEENWWHWMFDEYDQMFGYINILGTISEDFSVYRSIVKGSSWTIVDQADGYFQATLTVDEVNIYTLTAVFDESTETISISYNLFPEVKPYETWPTELVASAVEDVAVVEEGAEIDVLPPYSGENNGFKLNGNTIYVLVNEGDELAAIEAYVATLTTAGFVWDDDYAIYHSPNSQYSVTVNQTAESGVIEIVLGYIPEPIPTFDTFPSDYLKENFYTQDTKDVIPALDGADEYTCSIVHATEGDDVFGDISCTFKGENLDLTPQVTAYNAKLVELGFTVSEDWEGGYVSPNGEFVIRVSFEPETDIYGEYSVLTIFFDNIVDGNI